MNHLLRELAPITTAGWLEIEKEAKRTLKTTLAARRLVDFKGPQGWELSAIALGEQCHAGVTDTTSGGYPVLDHVRHLVDGPLVWAPGLDGALVLSMRGEDFELTVGEDFSIGYLGHDGETVRLYLEESFTFWLLSPQAGIPLMHRAAAARAPQPTPRARAA